MQLSRVGEVLQASERKDYSDRVGKMAHLPAARIPTPRPQIRFEENLLYADETEYAVGYVAIGVSCDVSGSALILEGMSNDA